MSDTPRTSAMIDKFPDGYSPRELDEVYELARTMESELSAKNEHAAQQLAACSCAALMDTPESHAKAKIERDNPFWSPAYEDVMRRTEECIQLRVSVGELMNALLLVRKSSEWACMETETQEAVEAAIAKAAQ